MKIIWVATPTMMHESMRNARQTYDDEVERTYEKPLFVVAEFVIEREFVRHIRTNKKETTQRNAIMCITQTHTYDTPLWHINIRTAVRKFEEKQKRYSQKVLRQHPHKRQQVDTTFYDIHIINDFIGHKDTYFQPSEASKTPQNSFAILHTKPKNGKPPKEQSHLPHKLRPRKASVESAQNDISKTYHDGTIRTLRT